MLFNIAVTSLVLLFSVLLTVNTSPVPDHNGLALLDLMARQDTYVFGRDTDLERRQGGGPGGTSGTGSAGGAGRAKAAAGTVFFQVHLDVNWLI
jgi:hypothetical protein